MFSLDGLSRANLAAFSGESLIVHSNWSLVASRTVHIVKRFGRSIKSMACQTKGTCTFAFLYRSESGEDGVEWAFLEVQTDYVGQSQYTQRGTIMTEDTDFAVMLE